MVRGGDRRGRGPLHVSSHDGLSSAGETIRIVPSRFALSSRSHSALLTDREARWKSFLERIGGVESLSFKLTRQSGNRWKIFNVTQEDRNRQELRGLIHEGVEAFGELNV